MITHLVKAAVDSVRCKTSGLRWGSRSSKHSAVRDNILVKGNRGVGQHGDSCHIASETKGHILFKDLVADRKMRITTAHQSMGPLTRELDQMHGVTMLELGAEFSFFAPLITACVASVTKTKPVLELLDLPEPVQALGVLGIGSYIALNVSGASGLPTGLDIRANAQAAVDWLVDNGFVEAKSAFHDWLNLGIIGYANHQFGDATRAPLPNARAKVLAATFAFNLPVVPAMSFATGQPDVLASLPSGLLYAMMGSWGGAEVSRVFGNAGVSNLMRTFFWVALASPMFLASGQALAPSSAYAAQLAVGLSLSLELGLTPSAKERS